MAMNYKRTVVEGSVVYLLWTGLNSIWNLIGQSFGLFDKFASAGLMGLTVGGLLAFIIGVPLGRYIYDEILAKKIKQLKR